MERKDKIKNIFVKGEIPLEKISTSIANHQHKTDIGAHNIFLGQVREDNIASGKVKKIHFTAYEEMANQKAMEIREKVYEKYDIKCLHIYHSLGEVEVGKICFFVFVSSAHRPAVYKALQYLVDELKKELPIFGKELNEDGQYQWKENKYYNT